MILKRHPKHDILVSEDGETILNAVTGYQYNIMTTRKGYKRVQFSYKKKGITFKYYEFIHRLVAETYLEKQPYHKYVDHIDRVRDNNHVDNLRWATHKQNIRNSAVYKHGNYATV